MLPLGYPLGLRVCTPPANLGRRPEQALKVSVKPSGQRTQGTSGGSVVWKGNPSSPSGQRTASLLEQGAPRADQAMAVLKHRVREKDSSGPQGGAALDDIS